MYGQAVNISTQPFIFTHDIAARFNKAPKSLGMASEIIARINERSFLYLEAPVKRVTNFDVVTPFFGRELMYMPTPGRVLRGIEETLDF